MAKKSMVDKNEKRLVKINKFFAKRKSLLQKRKHGDLSFDESMLISKRLDETSFASPIKYRKRCKDSGRGRGYRGWVGLCRSALRHYASFGMINGLKKG